jgi:hypothetical protein
VRSFALDLVTGSLTLYLVEERRACCIHVRDGEPATQPTGTITLKDGQVLSFELCRVCSAMHTLTTEQLAEQDFRNALRRVMQEEELRSDEGAT